jgi:hypothetical protein
MNHLYEVKQSDSFSHHLYPEVVSELILLRERSVKIKSSSKTKIIISFLKDHSIEKESLKSNAEISKLMTSGSVAISHLESLFTACRSNSRFLKEFEEYIRISIA